MVGLDTSLAMDSVLGPSLSGEEGGESSAGLEMESEDREGGEDMVRGGCYLGGRGCEGILGASKHVTGWWFVYSWMERERVILADSTVENW